MKTWGVGVAGLAVLIAALWIGRDGLGQLNASAVDGAAYRSALSGYQSMAAAEWIAIGDGRSSSDVRRRACLGLATADRGFANALLLFGSDPSASHDAAMLRTSLLDSADAAAKCANEPPSYRSSDYLLRIALDRQQQQTLEDALVVDFEARP
jgi:hypothetical protein